MIINTNVDNSLFYKKNNFLNSYFKQNEESFANCFIIDVHPLYGYVPEKRIYVWSFGYYLYNLFMFSHFNDNDSISNSIFHNTNTIISYYIIYHNHDLSNLEEDLIMQNVQCDIREMKKLFPINVIKIYSTKKNIQKKYVDGIFAHTDFDLIKILEESF